MKGLRGGRFVSLLAAPFVSVLLLGSTPAPAAAGVLEETTLLTLANTLRATVGAGPLAVDARLTAVAQTWSDAMAAADDISHNPNLASQISGWSRMAENVGMGPSILVVHQALMDSPGHYTNLTNPLYTHTGMAVTVSGLTVFVTQVFTRQGAAPVASRPASPAPALEPVAVTATTLPRRVPGPTATAPAPPATTARAAVTAQSLAPSPPAVPPSEWVEFVYERLRVLDPGQISRR